MTRVRIVVDGQAHEAHLETEQGDLFIVVDGERFVVDRVQAAATGTRALTVVLDGHEHLIDRLDLEHVLIDEAESTFRIEDAERAAAGAAVGESGLTVRPPMPGRIVRLHVAVGDIVEAGTVIAVLEAMKMQNEVASPGTGTVRRIHVQEGDTVDAQTPILELGPPEESDAAEPATKEVTA